MGNFSDWVDLGGLLSKLLESTPALTLEYGPVAGDISVYPYRSRNLIAEALLRPMEDIEADPAFNPPEITLSDRVLKSFGFDPLHDRILSQSDDGNIVIRADDVILGNVLNAVGDGAAAGEFEVRARSKKMFGVERSVHIVRAGEVAWWLRENTGLELNSVFELIADEWRKLVEAQPDPIQASTAQAEESITYVSHKDAVAIVTKRIGEREPPRGLKVRITRAHQKGEIRKRGARRNLGLLLEDVYRFAESYEEKLCDVADEW